MLDRCELKACKIELGFLQTEKDRLSGQLQKRDQVHREEKQQFQQELQLMVKAQQEAESLHQKAIQRITQEAENSVTKCKVS